MGRGRAKAKQTKVARDLKYNSQEMDLDRLAKELHGEKLSRTRKMILTLMAITFHVRN